MFVVGYWPGRLLVRTFDLNYHKRMDELKALYIILTILGSGISVLLLVNAHFTRMTLEKISGVELKLTELLVKHDNTDERSRKNEFAVEVLKNKINKLENQFQVLKGE